MVPQLRELLLLLHVRHQTEIDLRLGDRGVHGLRSLLDVPADEPTDRAGRGVDEPPDELEIVLPSDELLDAPESFQRVRGEGARPQIPQFAGGWPARVLVPPGDLDPTVRVPQRRQEVD